jgi:hypothetical protein
VFFIRHYDESNPVRVIDVFVDALDLDEIPSII